MLHSVARMIQLAFEPAYDPFHSAFRMLRQVVFKKGKPLLIPRLKINDLYIAEPRRCLEIRLAGELKKAARKAAACQQATYGQRPSATNLFDRMAPMQDSAIQTLVNQGLFEADSFEQNLAALSERPLPAPLLARIRKANDSQADLLTFLLIDLEAVPFDGSNGLKDRTGLSEYRYDII